MACSSTLDEVPDDLDLYPYLQIEMAYVLFQWISFAATPSRTLNPLSVVIVGSMSGGFAIPYLECDWVVKFLLLVFGLYIIYILHCIIHIYKSLLILLFSHDLVVF